MTEIIDRVWFYSVYERPDGRIEEGFARTTKQRAVEDLIQRDKLLEFPDVRQWVKIVHEKFVPICE